LFFVSPRDPSRKMLMLAAEFSGGPPLRIGRPRTLFEYDSSQLGFSCEPARCYDVSADGERFYVIQRRPAPPRPPVTHISVILDWVDEVKANVPAAPGAGKAGAEERHDR
jgi:hypothetical protein